MSTEEYEVQEIIGDCLHRIKTKKKKKGDKNIKTDKHGHYKEGAIVYLIDWVGNDSNGEPWPPTFEIIDHVIHLEKMVMTYELNRALVIQQEFEISGDLPIDDDRQSDHRSTVSASREKSKSPSGSASSSKKRPLRRDRRSLEEKSEDRSKSDSAERRGLAVFNENKHVDFRPWRRGYLFKWRTQSSMDVKPVLDLLSPPALEIFLNRLKSFIKKLTIELVKDLYDIDQPELQEICDAEIKRRTKPRGTRKRMSQSPDADGNESPLRRSERQRRMRLLEKTNEEGSVINVRNKKRTDRRKRKHESITHNYNSDTDGEEESSYGDSDDDKTSHDDRGYYERGSHVPSRKRLRRHGKASSRNLSRDLNRESSIDIDEMDKKYLSLKEPVISRLTNKYVQCFIEMNIIENRISQLRKRHQQVQAKIPGIDKNTEAFWKREQRQSNSGDNSNSSNNGSGMQNEHDPKTLTRLCREQAMTISRTRSLFRSHDKSIEWLFGELDSLEDHNFVNMNDIRDNQILSDALALGNSNNDNNKNSNSGDKRSSHDGKAPSNRDGSITLDTEMESSPTASAGLAERILKKKKQQSQNDKNQTEPNLVSTFSDNSQNNKDDDNNNDDDDGGASVREEQNNKNNNSGDEGVVLEVD